jgi:hypothetical protein
VSDWTLERVAFGNPATQPRQKCTVRSSPQQQAEAQCKAQPYKVGSPPPPSNARAHHHNPATRSSPPHNQHHCQPLPDHLKDAVPERKAQPARSPLGLPPASRTGSAKASTGPPARRKITSATQPINRSTTTGFPDRVIGATHLTLDTCSALRLSQLDSSRDESVGAAAACGGG